MLKICEEISSTHLWKAEWVCNRTFAGDFIFQEECKWILKGLAILNLQLIFQSSNFAQNAVYSATWNAALQWKVPWGFSFINFLFLIKLNCMQASSIFYPFAFLTLQSLLFYYTSHWITAPCSQQMWIYHVSSMCVFLYTKMLTAASFVRVTC